MESIGGCVRRKSSLPEGGVSVPEAMKALGVGKAGFHRLKLDAGIAELPTIPVPGPPGFIGFVPRDIMAKLKAAKAAKKKFGRLAVGGREALAALPRSLRSVVLQVHLQGAPNTISEMALAIDGDAEAERTGFTAEVLSEIAKMTRDIHLLANVGGRLHDELRSGRLAPTKDWLLITEEVIEAAAPPVLVERLSHHLKNSAVLVVQVRP